MEIIILYHFEVKILLLLLLLNHNYEEFESLFIAELDIQAWLIDKGRNFYEAVWTGSVEPVCWTVRNRLKRLNTLLLNIVGLRLNDFEREVRDSELLLFFPSFIKRSILSDIFSIFSSLKKTFSTIFCSFLLKCKMYVWLEFRTWSYRVIKRHTDLDVDHMIVLILFSYCRIKQACYMWKDCILINVINPSLSLKFYSTIKTSLNWLYWVQIPYV